MIKPPCKGCEERHLKCHSSCERYLAYRKELERVREAKNKERIKNERSTGIPKSKRPFKPKKF